MSGEESGVGSIRTGMVAPGSGCQAGRVNGREDARHAEARTEWVWNADLRDAYHQAVTTVPDPRAVVVAQAAAFGRPTPSK